MDDQTLMVLEDNADLVESAESVESMPVKKKNKEKKILSRKSWSQEEDAELVKIFGSYIEQKVIPTAKQIGKSIGGSTLFRGRQIITLKNHIRKHFSV